MTERLAEDHVTVLRDTFLELLLQVATTVLVLAELRDLAHKVLQTRTREPVDYAKQSVGCPLTVQIVKGRTLTVDVAALVLRSVQTVHLAVRTIRATVHVEAILGAVMVIERSRSSGSATGSATTCLEPVRVVTPVLRKAVDAVSTILL